MAVVIAPCTLLETWRREATMLGFECVDRAQETGGGGSRPLLVLASWAKIPTPAEIMRRRGRSCEDRSVCEYAVICDEAHAMQSLRSQRTRDALALCSHQCCSGVILATGTPMKNGRPSNIFPLLLAVRHPLSQHRISFETRYCAAKRTKFCPWDTSGASNLQELQEKIRPVLIRKTKVKVPLVVQYHIVCMCMSQPGRCVACRSMRTLTYVW